jgi:hypothetical protein
MSGPIVFATILLIGSLDRMVSETESVGREIGIMLVWSATAHVVVFKKRYRSSMSMLTCNHSAVSTSSVSFLFLAASQSIRNNAKLPARVWHACTCSP